MIAAMTSIARDLLARHEKKARFLIVGGLNTIFGLGFYPIAYLVLTSLRSHYMLLLVLSQIPCVTVSFLTNKHLVFRTTGNYHREFIKFATYYALIFAVNLAALPILVQTAAMNPILAQTLFSVVTITASYFWQSRITFTRAPSHYDS